jgi:hypothetical protein
MDLHRHLLTISYHMFRSGKSTSAMYGKEIKIIMESIKSSALRTMTHQLASSWC